MDSLQAKVDAAAATVSSISTCSPATVVLLRELLLVDAQVDDRAAKTTTRGQKKTATATKRRPASVSSRAKGPDGGASLSTRDKSILATRIINAALKALSEAAKPPPPTTPCKSSDSIKRRSFRRSSSAPVSPLQPRALNRVATSPSLLAKATKPVPPSQSTGCLATVECARLAFACLRSAKAAAPDGQAVDYQLEAGTLALVGKLLSLNLHELAFKELRMLKKRLEPAPALAAAKTAKAAPPIDTLASASTTAMADLLDFQRPIAKSGLPTVTAFQLQTLKLVAATKRPAQIEALLPLLQETNPSSPAILLARLADEGGPDPAKATRQLASLSQLLLSLAPSVCSQDDGTAVESRLSPSPVVALQLQLLGFKTQLRWWRLARHDGNLDNDLLSPFTRCIRAFARRFRSDDELLYKTSAAAFQDILHLSRSQQHEPQASSHSPLATIHHILGSLAHSARQYDDAYDWFQRLRASLGPQSDSLVRICSISARLLAAALKRTELDAGVEELVREVADGLDSPLSGTVTELNDLLESLSLARRSVVGLLVAALDTTSASGRAFSPGLCPLLQTFLLRYPRFVRRWMGTPPGKDAAAKQVIQFDQRRRAVLQSMNQILDGAFMVIHREIQSGSAEWSLVDDVLQNCAALLQSVPGPAARAEQVGDYHVKISSLYFSLYLQLQKASPRPREPDRRSLQALSRSIDAVKERTPSEQDKAQLSTKLELFADTCKAAGRPDDAVRTLRSICTRMVEDGTMSDVAAALATQPPALAWVATEKASLLSRTLRSIAKLDPSWTDWTFFLPESERAAVLEHLLYLSSGVSAPWQPLRLHDPSLATLLRIYTLDKHPIRRLRVLLHLAYQNIGGEDDDNDELLSHIDKALEQAQKKEKADDASLAHYLPHLLAFHGSMSPLTDTDTELSSAAIRDAIQSWKSMTEGCQTRQDLYAVLDNPPGLLDHLQSLGSLASLRGDTQLQISLAELSISVARAFSSSPVTTACDSLVLGHSNLAAHCITIGRFRQAAQALEQSRALMEQNTGHVSRRAAAEFHLCSAEYYCGIGSFDEALRSISSFRHNCGDSSSLLPTPPPSQATAMRSTASLLRSAISLQKGDVQDALASIKYSVRTLSHAWAELEASLARAGVDGHKSLLESSLTTIETQQTPNLVAGPRFWLLASPLARSLLQISTVYAHIGMFQETLHYAESARKVAESTQSVLFKTQVSSWIGAIYAKAGQPEKALEILEAARDQVPPAACASRIRFSRQLGDLYWEMGQERKAVEYLEMAEESIRLLDDTCDEDAEQEDKLCSVGDQGRRTRASRAPAKTKKKAPTAAPTRTRRKVGGPGPRLANKAPSVPDMRRRCEDTYQSSLLATVALSRAVGLIRDKDWTSALAMLERVKELPKLFETLSQEQVMTATSLLGRSMEQMISDPVFSVVQDSTISFPAVCCGTNAGSFERAMASNRSSKGNLSPPRRGRGGRERGVPAFVEALRQAQEVLLEAHGSALSSASSGMIRRIASLLQSTLILLSATSAGGTNKAACASTGLATVAVDLVRNVTWAREQSTLKTTTTTTTTTAPATRTTAVTPTPVAPAVGDREMTTIPKQPSSSSSSSDPSSPAATSWPSSSSTPSSSTPSSSLPSSPSSRRPGIIDWASDMTRFQKCHVEMLPKSWNVVSMSLSDNRHDLCITKLQAGHGPFVLRLPLARATSRDADADVFSFDHGQQELQEVIRLANETSHSARQSTTKRERAAWWSQREALDARLGTLLATIETTWLGGFRGIFSQHERRPDLLARFQKSFQKMLDRYLPSRVRMARQKASRSPAVALDPRILDLFIGLGDATDGRADCEYDEALNDLLYFVVDILQFHGERNAYDEIDFDAMVVDTYDALGGYHAAARGRSGHGAGAHTVLVLDKALHAFPWESLPCMQGLAVSRVPSLACLRRLLAEAKTPVAGPRGHHVSGRSVSYMLNPSSDLEKTEAFFRRPFGALEQWNGTVNRAPNEADFERALSESDVMLYFGHGSGSQYIRGRTIRRLPKCRPATFLMGCSSAALTEAGDFECYGPVWNYMMAGCPAVVGTLWDVTDRDIDRFAGRTFEEWGLLPRGTFGDETETRASEVTGIVEMPSASLAEAVARARSICKFRYLNAAAVVVYGIPVYITKELDDDNEGDG